MQWYLNGCDVNVLKEEDAMLCDGELTIDECTLAVHSLKINKALGSDGLTSEFYKAFWDDVKNMLVDSIRCESDDVIWLRNHAYTCWFQTLDVNKPWRQIPADRLLFLVFAHFFFSDYPKAIRRGEISFKSNHVIERNFEAANGRITELFSSGQL